MALTKVGAMMKRLLSTEIQLLVKAGLINGDLELTAEGQKVLSACIFEQFKDKLVEEAKDIIAEDEKDNDKDNG